jgi:arginyl-tRNA synthetase
MDLWKKMNTWVYEGFDVTYKKIGSDFDKTYYESNTYLLGKDLVKEGLEKKVFYKKEDNSIWIDLTDEGLDEKLVMRKDGTSVYITQDVGLAKQKYEEYKIDKSVYVIGDEQNYHMKVLQLICKKLQMPYANNIHHLSYGMVELPNGKMKSREGNVVDADDLVNAMVQTAEEEFNKTDKIAAFSKEEKEVLFNNVAMAAMKFYLLKVDPKKKMIFNPEESIDMQGFTGPYIQYTHARIKSILRKNQQENTVFSLPLLPLEKELIQTCTQYQTTLQQAGEEMNPALVANYIYKLAKTFNSFYAEHKIATAENEEKKQLRLKIISLTAQVLKSGGALLGFEVPERM